ncbi:MAG: response regulator transcription factor [Abitibacteriaceae bacterium]|nr:response regulator transcription factor [Abditibacteriaceae bacterium]
MDILLIEDDIVIAELIKTGLAKAHFTVDVAHDGEKGLQLAQAGSYSVIILDLMLPRQDGWSICQSLRAQRDTTPILMLTARDTVEDRVRGLETGADDYLPKPFDFRELLARVRALMRRDKVHRSRLIQVGDLEIDTTSRSVRRGGQDIALTPREYTLLEFLAANEGRVVTREMIMDRVWRDDDSYSNTVDVYITFLRRKIDAAHDVKLIQTIHRMGYMLRSPATEGHAP